MADSNKRACVHVNYTVSNKNRRKDLCLVKEHIFHEDRVEKNIRLIQNARRDFYITAPTKQDHQSKKEWELARFCNRYECTQATLIDTLARVLKVSPSGLRRLNRNQYTYGTDILITSIIKNKYDKEYPNAPIVPTSAFMDYEWRIATKDLIVGTMVYEEHCHLTVDGAILTKIPNALEKLHECFNTYLIPYIHQYYQNNHDEDIAKKIKMDLNSFKALSLEDKKAIYQDIAIKTNKSIEEVMFTGGRNYQLHVDIVNSPVEVTSKLFSYSHLYRPDYLVFWNGESDFSTIAGVCKRANVDMASFTCDPDVPEEFRNAKFEPGTEVKLDANGNDKKIKSHERWHIFDNMASWQFLDLMCTYASNRAHLPQLSSYGLDAALAREVNLAKFKFSDHIESLANLTQEEWHNTMVRDYPIEYCIYAIFDCIGPQLLEDKTADIRGQFYPKLGISDIKNFKKNPRRIADKMHFELLEKGRVVGSTSDQMMEETDKLLYSADELIITLSSDIHYNMGVNCLEDAPEITTYFIPKAADADIKSSYPTNQRLFNMSKTTRYSELFKIDTLEIGVGKEIGMNISAGKGCAVDVCYRVYQLPHLQGWINHYRNKHHVR